MRRRRLVLLVSAITLGVLGLLAIATVFFVTRTELGREQVRSFLQPLLASRIQGKAYIGKLSGNFLTEITVDSFAIRDASGELFISTGPVTVSFNIRDLIDNRIVVRRARVEHPYVHVVQHEDGVWNFRRIFASKDDGPKQPRDPSRRGWGDYIVVDSTWTRNGRLLVTQPWHPDKELRGAARDSSIRAHLQNPSKMVTQRADGYARTYTFANAHGLVRHARINDPDSSAKWGRAFIIDTLSVDTYEPTFRFRDLSGNFQHLGDSIFIQVPHFDLPASTGSADGKIWWGNGPMRLAIDITGDSVSLNDVNWVYPTLPRTGGGRLDLRIANDPTNPKIIDYHLRDMNVRSTKSHLTGNMSFGTGQGVLLVRNVDLKADPVDFDLMRTLAGGPFPYDWQGQLFGTVRARGGPLTNFVVDDARGTFRDAHVPGAVSRFTARGELDILVPKVTAFHGFDVENAVIDLRTIEYLNKNFPRLGGFIAGRATLDSSWLDVRFSNADITHQNGPGEPSHLTGSGRITYGDVLTYDVNLDAQPLSLTMLARSPTFANMPFRGLMSGPIKAKGEASALDVSTSLQGAVGSLSFDGRVDVDSIGGFGARGSGSFSAINVGAILEKTNVPAGTFSGRYTADVAGETAATLQGFVDLSLDSTVVDSVRVHETRARVEFADGRLKIVDSVRVRSTAGTLIARGGFGLPKGRSDSLFLRFTVDSLGGLRRYLATHDTTVLATAKAVVDSLSGSAEFVGSLIGTADSFRLVGRATGGDLYMNKNRGDTAWVTLDLQDLPSAAKGVVEARVDSVMLGGLLFDRLGGSLALTDPKNARFSASALSHNGLLASAIGNWTRAGGDQIVVVDSLGLTVGDDRWQLTQAARVTLDSTKGIRLDSVAFRNRDSAVVTLSADVPAVGPAFARLRASKVPLMDLGLLEQLVDTVRGQLDASVDVTGTKQNPEISATARLSSVLWRSVTVDSARANGTYRTGRFEGKAGVFRKGDTAFAATASLPARVTLFSVRQRDDSIRAELRAKSADLEIVKALMSELRPAQVSGNLSGQLKVAGTWRAPVVDGDLAIADGRAFVPQLGVVYTAINGQIRGFRPSATTDSLQINLSASSEGVTSGNVIIDGYVKNLLQSRNNQEFDITVDPSNFHVLNKRSTADLYLSLPDRRLFPGDNRIRLKGTTRAPTLTGRLVVNRGSIYLADRDIARKQTIEIPVDSATRARSAIIDTLMSNLRVQNVTITLGEDVRLRSAEANVKLSGSLQLQATTNRSRRINTASGAAIPLFDLDGVLLTESGTYSLNLGVVRREFNVLQGGTVTFDGDPNNPLLDIRAQHNVRRPGDRDLGVIVNLHDRLLPYPVIDFLSDADYTIAQSDLISYLLIGRPGFDYTANARTAQTVMSFLSPTLSALAADQFRSIPGLSSFVDAFQFQLGSSDLSGTSGANFREILTGATIGAEKQFKNVFVSLSTGFCQFHTPGQNFDVGQLLGAKAEWRLLPTKANTALKLSYDPPAASRICGQQSIIGFVNTPGQFGLSFSHSWRF
jgi:translocation and assembly module TamB